jgi:hypothetical protein
MTGRSAENSNLSSKKGKGRNKTKKMSESEEEDDYVEEEEEEEEEDYGGEEEDDEDNGDEDVAVEDDDDFESVNQAKLKKHQNEVSKPTSNKRSVR